MPHAPAVAVQIAHAAGWGGYDDATDAALGVFANWAAAERFRVERLLVDISGVVLPSEFTAKIQAASGAPNFEPPQADRHRTLAGHLRALGLERVLFGTDWPVFTPAAH